MSVYVTSVGMEVHAELLTESKMFCRCPVAFGGEPNTRVCPVCLGLPGALPVPNRHAVELVMKTALALNCTVPTDSVFHRKNYFYPDIPKGYQTSQYGETNPIGYHGWLDFPGRDGQTKRVRIRRVHLEEDTGKLIHLPGQGSGIDYNRAGVPLMEIVTEFPPDLDNSEDAREYLVQLRSVLVWLGVCDGKMEEGSLRCEPNISVRQEGAAEYGTKTELKNLNSFRSVQLGVDYEVARQVSTLQSGGAVAQETRGWNETTLSSYSMRSKEEEQDYRYFPCPDLVPMQFSPGMVEDVRKGLPELPLAIQARYQRDWGLSASHAGQLVSDRAWAEFFEEAVRLGGPPQAVCNWMNGDFAKLLNANGQSLAVEPKTRVTPAHIAQLAQLVGQGTLSSKAAKVVMAEMFGSGSLPAQIVDDLGLGQVSDANAIAQSVAEVLAQNPAVVEQVKSGKVEVVGFLVGQVMKATQGKANPSLVNEEVRRQLGL